MRVKYKIVAMLAALALLLGSADGLSARRLYAADGNKGVPVRVVALGSVVESAAGVNVGGRVFADAESVFTALGASVFSRADRAEAYVSKGAVITLVRAGAKELNVNGTVKPMSEAPFMSGGKMMVPVRFVAEAFGFAVSYDEKNKITYITEPVTKPETKPAATPGPTPAAKTEGVALDPSDVVDVEGYTRPETGDLAADVSLADIPAERRPKTRIVGVSQTDADGYSYTISAESAVSRVEKFLLPDNRLVIDIYNAEMALSSKLFEFDGPYLSTIRAGQNQVKPEFITRVVFDLSQPVSYALTISADRTALTVSFRQNAVTSVTARTEGGTDYIYITGVFAPATLLFPLRNPDRLVIDLPLCVADEGRIDMNGALTKSVRTGQFEKGRARIVADLSEQGSYFVETDGDTTIIKITKATYRNFTFNSESALLTIPKGAVDLSVGDIKHIDRYNEFKYTLVLPGDYSAELGSGEKLVKDGVINSIDISTVDGTTAITFNENKIMAYAVTENDANIYFHVMEPKAKYSRIVVIDPGHGGSDPGTNGFGLIERDLTLDTALRLVALLEDDPTIKVYATRLEDVYPTLQERVAFAAGLGDLFVSVHYNAMENNSASNGTETYWHDHALPSGYTITGKRCAEIIHAELLAALGLKDRGVKTADFYVTRHADIPAVLAEICFLTNAEDNAKAGTEEFRQQAARALYDGIVKIFGGYQPPR